MTQTETEEDFEIPEPEPVSDQQARRAYAARMQDDEGFEVVTPPATGQDLPEQYRPRGNRG